MTSPVRQVQQLTAEVPASVVDAVWGLIKAEQCPESNAACDAAGVQRCGHRLDLAITVAFNAGRESAFDGGVTEWAARCTSDGHDHESDAGVFFVRVDQERDRVERYIAAADLSFELVTRRRAELVEPWQVVADAD